jgi:hypothetical protein
MIEMKKILVVGIILLFIGVAVAPSINHSVVTASQEDDFVEVTTQTCGIRGFRDTTVKLTRQQYSNLEQYLVEFRAKLNQTSTSAEAIPILKEAVVELDKYGLLLKGVSVRYAQDLVVRSLHAPLVSKAYEKVAISQYPTQDSDRNVLCLIAGHTTCTFFDNIVSVLSYVFEYIFYNFDMQMLQFLCYWLQMVASGVCNLNPFSIMNRINLGNYYYDSPDEVYKAAGWVTTVGLLGMKKTEGDMIGVLPFQGTAYTNFYRASVLYPAAIGFTGIKIGIPDHEFYYIGSALLVDISSES